MNFAELRFWGWLALGLGVVLFLRLGWRWAAPAQRERFDRVALMGLGLFLLACVSWLTCAIYLTVAVVSYIGLTWILRHDPRALRRYLFILIPLQLVPLAYYKYANFIVNGVLVMDVDSLRDLLIPAGLSFYTFQMIGFVLDTLARKEPLPRFLDFLNFAGFFPQIVAGPIERKRDLLPQMERFRFSWDAAQINEGAAWVAVGLFFKMCLADNLAKWMGPFMGSTTNPFIIWVANVIFGLRIYYDFAGYSLVAYGVARCLGVRLTLNFLSPYCSTSIQEFWRRWHVTLSNWFRDYVYIPLGGGRTGRWALNLALVFLLSGIWHGAGWNFVVWGALHGGFLITIRLTARWTPPAPLAWAGTMAAAFLAWLAFYELRTDVMWAKYATLLSPTAYSPGAFKEALTVLESGELIVLASLFGLAGVTLVMEWLSVRRHNEPFVLLRRPLVTELLVVLTVLLAPGKNNAFIYFAF